jgi:hypothetical protein
MDPNEVFDALALLSEKDQRQAQARLTVLLAGSQESPHTMPARVDEKMVYDALSSTLKLVSMTPAPYGVFLSGKAAPRFKQDVPPLLEFIARSFGSSERTDVVQATQLCFGTLVGWMQKRNIPVSTTAAIRNLRNIPEALDCAFPGYAAGGHLRLLLDGHGSS